MSNLPHVLVGCELFIRKGNTLLLGIRKNSFGAGEWALPGGHLEPNERLVDAACREAKEELDADITPQDLRLASVVDGIPQQDSKKHYIHMSFELLEPTWEPKLMEPEFCEEWRYWPLDALPPNIFSKHQAILANYQAGRLYTYEKA